MPAIIQAGPRLIGPQRVVFGIGHDLLGKIDGVPLGAKVRVRQRDDDFAIAFVRTERAIERWAIHETDQQRYELIYLQGRNEVLPESTTDQEP